MAKSIIFFSDFDGTIADKDVCATMVKQFAASGWYELNCLWEAGKLSTRECAQRTLDLMAMTPAELDDFIGTQVIDPTFLDFAAWAGEKGYPIYILSDGYDNYIRPILARYNLGLPFYANRMHYRRGWKIETPHDNPRCGRCGVCKSKIMLELMNPDGLNVYIGDGYSDRCPAHFAGLVFARAGRSLEAYCAREGITAHRFNNFQGILRQMKKLTE